MTPPSRQTESQPTISTLASQLQELTDLCNEQTQDLQQIKSLTAEHTLDFQQIKGLLRGPLDRPHEGLVMRMYSAEKALLVMQARENRWKKLLIGGLVGCGFTLLGQWLAGRWHLPVK